MRFANYSSVVLCSFALASCVVVEEGASSVATPESGYSGTEGSDAGPPGWQAGYQRGLADGQGGLSRTPDRYSPVYSEADRSAFFSGYESGYSRGIKP